jgi:hypothetical protein
MYLINVSSLFFLVTSRQPTKLNMHITRTAPRFLLVSSTLEIHYSKRGPYQHSENLQNSSISFLAFSIRLPSNFSWQSVYR